MHRWDLCHLCNIVYVVFMNNYNVRVEEASVFCHLNTQMELCHLYGWIITVNPRTLSMNLNSLSTISTYVLQLVYAEILIIGL